MTYEYLSQYDVDHFVQYGFLKVPHALDPEFCRAQTDHAFDRLGIRKDDASTWLDGKTHMPRAEQWPIHEIAPTAWAAICDLCGGRERIKDADEAQWGNGFILNFSFGADRKWDPPSADVTGWHKDGDFFYHFLDSPEQGLLCAVYWSDVKHQGGGTYIIPDSIGVVAEFLSQNREGIHPSDPRWRELPGKCRDFREVTAETGDVYLLHPYMLHASSQNVIGVPRFMTNPPITLAAPMEFNREDAADFSPVELAVLNGLGVERLDFQLEGERRENVPERVKRQREMLAQEKARLGEQ